MWRDKNTDEYEGTYDHTKVEIVGWEYAQVVGDGLFSTCIDPEKPTHKVAWMRPKFRTIAPEGFVWVDAYDCWPVGRPVTSEVTGCRVERPDRGTMVLVPLPKGFGE